MGSPQLKGQSYTPGHCGFGSHRRSLACSCLTRSNQSHLVICIYSAWVKSPLHLRNKLLHLGREQIAYIWRRVCCSGYRRDSRDKRTENPLVWDYSHLSQLNLKGPITFINNWSFSPWPGVQSPPHTGSNDRLRAHCFIERATHSSRLHFTQST